MSGCVIQTRGLTKHFGDTLAVDNVGFDLEPGEILSILGPSGCGKTTLLRLIAGFEVPGAGEISVQGRLVSDPSVHVPPEHRRVGMVFQEYALFPHMTVGQNVAFGLQRLAKSERRRHLAEVLELVRLTGLEDRYPHELSGGQQQRVALARTLAPRPTAVLLDEPFSNIDQSMRRTMRQEVQSILRENQIAAVFVTHDREEAFAMADRVGVMRGGRIDQLDRPYVVYSSPATPLVAQMTGTCDFLRGEIRDGLAITEAGRLPCTTVNGPVAEGGQVELLVHPDDFRAVPDSQGKGVVWSVEFRGDETMLMVALPSGATLRCRQPAGATFAAGTRITLVPQNSSPFPVFERPKS